MKKRILLAAVCCLAASQWAGAQNSQSRWAVGINPSLYSFYALKSGSNFFKGEDYGGGVALSLYRWAGNSFDIGMETGFGLVRHPDDVDAITAQQRDNFFHVQLAAKYKLDNGYILKKESIVSPFLKVGVGTNTYKDFKNWGLHIPVGIGLTVKIPKSSVNVTVQTSGNIAILGQSYLHHSLGFSINLGDYKKKSKKADEDDDKKPIELPQKTANTPPDRDYDGVADEVDRCPDINGSSVTMGCPDSDSDGVADAEDRCPDEKGYANMLGCADSDHDGVIDPDDKCPDAYGEVPEGCPIADANDTDNDDVPNDKDECPDVKGLFTANGCPDMDGDGIKDADDECPDYFGVKEHNGCPLPKAQLEEMKTMYENEKLAAKYDISDARNPYNPRNDKFNPKDPRNPFNPNNPNFDVNNPNNPFNPENPLFDINNPDNPYNPKSLNYNPKYEKEKPYKKYAHNGNHTNPTHNPNNGNNGNNGNGSFVIGPVITDAPLGNLTGFPEPKELTKEEEEYCNRLDIKDLKAAIYFNPADAQANGSSLQSLDKIVEAMRKCSILELQVAGHADSDGSETFNESLSEKRAQAVLRYIAGQGIEDKRLKFNAYGEKYPTAPNDSPENKQRNRRAEIKIQRTN